MINPKELIKQKKVTPKLDLGQNFVIDRSVIGSLITAAKINRDDKVVGNIPYHISEPLVWKFRLKPVEEMVFVTGIRFAHRLAAKIGDKNYGDVSVVFQTRFDISIEKEFSKSSFYPPPPTKSALIKMIPVSINSLLNNPSRFILRYIWDRKEMKLKNALREALIDYVAKVSHDKKQLTKKEAKFLIDSLGIPGGKLEKIVDSGDCSLVTEALSRFDYVKVLKKDPQN